MAALLLACAVGWSGIAAADGASPLDASPQDKKRAQARYEDGAKLFEARRFADALKAFHDSYRIVASPNSHLMVARSLRELGQLPAAYEELEKAEEEARALSSADAAKYGPTVEKATADREALRPKVGFVTVRVKGGELSDLSVGGRAIPRERWARPAAANPGTVEVAGTGRDGGRVARSVSVNPGASVEAELDLTPRANAAPVPPPVGSDPVPPGPTPDSGGPPKKSLLPWVFVAGGVGVVGLGLGTAFGIMNNSTHDEYEAQRNKLESNPACTKMPDGSLRCPASAETQNHEDTGDKGRTQQTIANVGYIVGGVGLAAAAALLVVDLTRSSKKEAQTPGPTLAVGWRSVELTSTF